MICLISCAFLQGCTKAPLLLSQSVTAVVTVLCHSQDQEVPEAQGQLFSHTSWPEWEKLGRIWSPPSWEQEGVGLRTQLSSGALCAVRDGSAEQSERSRQCVSSGEGINLLKKVGEKYHKLN